MFRSLRATGIVRNAVRSRLSVLPIQSIRSLSYSHAKFAAEKTAGLGKPAPGQENAEDSKQTSKDKDAASVEEEPLEWTLSRVDRKLKKAAQLAGKELNDAFLINRPDLWKGLPDDMILKLHRKRVVSLGKRFKHNKDELEALLSTAGDPAEAAFIQKVYYEPESQQFDSDIETDYENYITEGEFMEDSYEQNENDELPTKAQDILRDFQEQLDFNRKAAYELPALAKLREKYVRPSQTEKPVVLRYTSYLGEEHPGARKVVMTVKVSNLQLSDAESHKLKLVAGPRYDYTTDILRMSADGFLEAAQNASYLSEILNNLIAESKRNPEEFLDVPLDTRAVDARNNKKQHRNKRQYEFPEQWEKPIQPEDRKVNLKSLFPLD